MMFVYHFTMCYNYSFMFFSYSAFVKVLYCIRDHMHLLSDSITSIFILFINILFIRILFMCILFIRIQGNLPIADIPNSGHAMNSGQNIQSQIFFKITSQQRTPLNNGQLFFKNGRCLLFRGFTALFLISRFSFVYYLSVHFSFVYFSHVYSHLYNFQSHNFYPYNFHSYTFHICILLIRIFLVRILFIIRIHFIRML